MQATIVHTYSKKERKVKTTMLKRILGILVTLVLLLGTLAIAETSEYTYMNYRNRMGNEAMIETLAEARANAPAAVQTLYGNAEKTYQANPLLDTFPEDTVYIYRSANIYGGQVSARNNTSFLVFSERSFADKSEALSYLESLGLVDLIDSVIGSVTLYTPSDPRKGFTQSDLANYYNLHTAMYTQRTYTKTDDGVVYDADAEYYGSYGKVYFIGIDGGSTFINNYIAPGDPEFIGQAAGLMLIGGEMDPANIVSKYVPTYILNGTDTMVQRYRDVNQTNAYGMEDGIEIFYDESIPLHKVLVAKGSDANLADSIQDAFNRVFAVSQRVSVIRSMTQESSLTPLYQEYVSAPAISRYALCNRNAIVDGVTVKGNLHVSFHQEEIFSDIKTMYDQYLQTWYEVLPESVLDGTAPEGSVPLILALHGTGDDPLMFIDEIGWLDVAGNENFAIVAPFEEELIIAHEGGKVAMGVPIYEGILDQAFPVFLNYILDKYPALDANRVYATGYSLGGGSVYRAVYGGMSMIAAATSMAGMHDDMIYASTPEQDAQLKEIGMPMMILTSTFDLGYDQRGGRLTDNTLMLLDIFAEANSLSMGDARDFETYPMIGYAMNTFKLTTINGEWRSFLWAKKNADGVPVVELSCTENLTHALYPNYSVIAWDYMKHFSRNPETGLVTYDASVK